MLKSMLISIACMVIGGLVFFVCLDTASDDDLGKLTETQQNQVVFQTIKDDTSLRAITVTSSQDYYTDKWRSKRTYVITELNRIISSGKYNIVSIITNYNVPYLTSAIVKYSIAPDCEKRKLRALYLFSNRKFIDQKEEEVKPQLDAIINSGKYNIIDFKTVMLKGFLVAAEVYYYEK